MSRSPGGPKCGEWRSGDRACFLRRFRRGASLRAAIFLLSIWLCIITVINLGSSGQQSSLGLKDDAPLFPRYGGRTSFPSLPGLSTTNKSMEALSSTKVEAKLSVPGESQSSTRVLKSSARALDDGPTSNLVKSGFISGRRIQEIKIHQIGGLEILDNRPDGLAERQARHNGSNSEVLSSKSSRIDAKAEMDTQRHIQAPIKNARDLYPNWGPESEAQRSSSFHPDIQEHELSLAQEGAKRKLTISSRTNISQHKPAEGYHETRPQESEMTVTASKYGLLAHEKSISGHLLAPIRDRHNRESSFYDSSEINKNFNGNKGQRAGEMKRKIYRSNSQPLSVEQSYRSSSDPVTASNHVKETQSPKRTRPKLNLPLSAVQQIGVPKQNTAYLLKNGFHPTIRTSGYQTNLGGNYPAYASTPHREIEPNKRKQWRPSLSRTKLTNSFSRKTLKEIKLPVQENELSAKSNEFAQGMNSDVSLEKDQLPQIKGRSFFSANLASVVNKGQTNNDTDWKPKRLAASASERSFKYDGFELYSYNVTASDALPANRSVPDTRPIGCQHIPAYAITSLPRATVIICFHNEALSVLLRTVNSVIDRTPSYLLEKIILVDDYSTKDDLSAHLQESLKTLDKVLLTRTSKRTGLVGARILGSRLASSEVIVFLDAHCECNIGWLQPLLFSLRLNAQKVVSPYIDTIKSENFQYKQSPAQLRGGFTWRLEFAWRAATRGTGLLEETQSILTPVISGGLFAVRRDYFISMGAYDPELSIWGGENFELSFKTWMCGGSVEIVPCSRVGHVFRSSLPYTFTEGREKTVLRNLARVAHVWMDEYADTFYAAVNLPDHLDIGDTSDRERLRTDLNCKSFKWYLDNVFPEMDIVSPDTVVYGQVRNKGSLMCIDVIHSGCGYHLGLSACNGGRNQTLHLTSDHLLKQGSACVAPGTYTKQLTLSDCTKDIKWVYKNDQLRLNNTELCATSVDNEMVYLLPCRGDNENSAATDVSTSNFDSHQMDKSYPNKYNSVFDISFQQWTFDYNFNWKRRRRRRLS